MFKDTERKERLREKELSERCCPAGSVFSCTSVMSAHEKKTKETCKHSWDLAQSLGQGYDRGWGNERGFQSVVNGVVC